MMKVQTEVFAVQRKKTRSCPSVTDFDKIHHVWELMQIFLKLLQLWVTKTALLQMNLGKYTETLL